MAQRFSRAALPLRRLSYVLFRPPEAERERELQSEVRRQPEVKILMFSVSPTNTRFAFAEFLKAKEVLARTAPPTTKEPTSLLTSALLRRMLSGTCLMASAGSNENCKKLQKG